MNAWSESFPTEGLFSIGWDSTKDLVIRQWTTYFRWGIGVNVRVFDPIAFHIFTKDGEWVTEKGVLTNRVSPFLTMDGDPSVLPGTSGASVFNDEGEVVGIV